MICSSLPGFYWSFDQLLDQLRVRYLALLTKTVRKDELQPPKEKVSLLGNSSEKRVKSPINGVGGAGMGPLAQRRVKRHENTDQAACLKRDLH